MSETEATGTNGQTTPARKKAAKAKAPKKAAVRKRAAAAVKVGDITINHNIPIPKVSKDKGKYPFLSLSIGDSFLVPCPKNKMKAMRANLKSAARRIATKTGAEFLVLERPNEKGVRCWRIGKEHPKDTVPSEAEVTQEASRAPNLSAFSGPKPE